MGGKLRSDAGGRPARRPRRIVVQIVAPLAAAFAVAVLAAVAGLFAATSRSDAISVERQIRVARHAVDRSVDDLALQQETVAIWDESAAELAKPAPDPVWMRDNVSMWLHNIFGHDEVFILDRSDRPIHAMREGQVVAPRRYDALAADLALLLDGVRGRRRDGNGRHDRNPGLPLNSDSTVLTTPRTTHDSHLMLVGGRPAAASAMLIKESTPGWVRQKGPWSVLVSVRYLDGEFLTRLAERDLIEAPRFSRTDDKRPGEQETLLQGAAGRPIGYLIWRPDLPGSRILQKLTPMTAGLVLVMAAIMGVLAWRLTRTTTDLAAAEAASARLARHDALTGLPNRALLGERLAMLAARPRRRVALLLVDLDRFKQINDTLGHQAGDLLLSDFAARLAQLVGPADTVARLGGDEFAVLVTNRARADVAGLAGRILDAAARAFVLPGGTVFVGASIGVAVAAGRTIGDELVRRADVALYAAKADGRGCARFYKRALDAPLKERALIEDDLRQALARGGLAVWYQPQVTRDGELVGVEALLRWTHPTRGAISPEVFVRLAEEAGLIGDLGDWTMRQAAAAAARWPDLTMAINISPAEFRSPGFAERAIRILAATGVDPSRIELEVTERILLEASAQCLDQIERLRAAGFRLALDDFGTGYSSLSYLQRFRVDKIKIDRSFVGRLPESPDSHAIVAAILNLAQSLGLRVTAEGVETQGQLDLLVAGGCQEFQGYHFWPACPATEIDAILGHRQGRAA